MTSSNVLKMRALRDSFLATLTKTQRERSLRPDWVLHERRVMRDAVNAVRIDAGLAPVAIAAVERVETMAVGHSDYSSKFALYCAELALGIREINGAPAR